MDNLISEAEALKEGGTLAEVLKQGKTISEDFTSKYCNNIFSSRLRRLRFDKGLNASELAKGTGLSLTAILGYEDGSQVPKMDSLIKLADFFNVSLDYLAGRTNLRRLPDNEQLLLLENKLLELGGFAEQFRQELSYRDGDD